MGVGVVEAVELELDELEELDELLLDDDELLEEDELDEATVVEATFDRLLTRPTSSVVLTAK